MICYQKEFIFAEKLETILYRGAFNSRMKDFHDIHSLITSKELSFQNLSAVIHSVFEHRGTALTLPITYNEEGMGQMQKYWSEYLKTLQMQKLKKLPTHFASVIDIINDWLSKNLEIFSKI